MRLEGVIDCLIPRGGPSLIAIVLERGHGALRHRW